MVHDFLKDIDLFKNLNDGDLNSIESIARERTYRKGSIIVSEGSSTSDMYIVKSGKVKIYKAYGPEEKCLVLNIKGKGGILAGYNFFNNSPTPATIVALEDSEICVLKTSEIENIIKTNSELALNFIKLLSKELQNSLDKMKHLVLDDAYVKTAKLLLNLSEKYGVLTSDNATELNINITRSDMANMVGTSRETVSRALSQFNKEKSIGFNGRNIVIYDFEKLKEWLR